MWRAAVDCAGRSRLPRCRAAGRDAAAAEPHAAADAGVDAAAQTAPGDRTDDRAHERRGLLARNWLKGAIGDAMHAVLRGAGHNLRPILAHLRVLLLALLGLLLMQRITSAVG